MVLAKVIDRFLSILSTLILVRLLAPADFGIVALAASLIALLEVATALGFDSALIRDQAATRSHYDTAWTLNLLLTVGMAVAMLVLALPAAWFYSEPRLAPVVAVLALSPLIQGCENIGVVAFRKELDFRREFLFLGGKRLAMFCVALPLAFALGNYWALVAGTVVGRATGLVLSYAIHPYRPRFCLAQWRALFGFSRWLLVINISAFVRERYPDLVLGRVVGPSGLGLYSVGAGIAQLPSSELTAPINRAVFPGLSVVASDSQALRRAFLSAQGMTALLGVPAAVGIAASAPVLVPTLLGEQWVNATQVVALLAWVGALQIVNATTHPAFLALNKLSVPAIIGVCHAIALVFALPVLGVKVGLSGVLLGILCARLVSVPATIMFALQLLHLRLGDLVRVLWRPLVGAAIMYVTVISYLTWAGGKSGIAVLATAVGLGIASYVVSVLALWWISGRPCGAEQAVMTELVRHRARLISAWR
jgi:O-antigen/teichoic acid export membrane protein